MIVACDVRIAEKMRVNDDRTAYDGERDDIKCVAVVRAEVSVILLFIQCFSFLIFFFHILSSRLKHLSLKYCAWIFCAFIVVN